MDRKTKMSETSKQDDVSGRDKDREKEKECVKSTKSFSINSILARVEKEKKQEECQDENKGNHSDDETSRDKEDADVPAVVSKLEFPVFPGLGRGFAELSRHVESGAGTGAGTGSGGFLPLSHLPAWYHWYASQQSLQHWQQQQQQQQQHQKKGK